MNIFAGAILFLGLLLVSTSACLFSKKKTETKMPSVITATLRSQLQAGGKATAIVAMARDTQEALDKVEKMQFASRDERATAVTTELQKLADESQKPLKDFLTAQGANFESMWINNSIVVREATLDLLEKLEALGGIKEIREEAHVNIMTGGMGVGMGADL